MSSWTTIVARPVRRTFRSLREPRSVRTVNADPSHVYHTTTEWMRPSARALENTAGRTPPKNSSRSLGLIWARSSDGSFDLVLTEAGWAYERRTTAALQNHRRRSGSDLFWGRGRGRSSSLK